MQNISFDDGYKEFSINNDESRVIRFNPSDFGLIERIKQAYEAIEKAEALKKDVELKPDGSLVDNLGQSAEILKEIRETITSQIDHIFDSPVSDIAFGNQSPLSMVNGVPLYERFLNAAIPYMKKEIDNEMKASQKRISKYTDVVK